MPESGEEGETTGVKPPYIYKCEGTYLQGKKEMRDFGFTSFYVALREFSQNEGFVLAWKSHGTH